MQCKNESYREDSNLGGLNAIILFFLYFLLLFLLSSKLLFSKNKRGLSHTIK